MTRLWFVALMSVGGTLAAFGVYGCQQSEPAKTEHELCVQAQKDVTLRGVVVKLGDQTIPFGVVNHFGASWFPVRYEPGTDYVIEVSWWEKAVDDQYSSTVTVKGPRDEAELREFDGIQLTYSKASGWTGEVLRSNGSESE